ncbi:3-oxoacid CoA-transferase subunit B [Brevibacillus formosus]|uniref:Acyl CoA:acetate/3-ketoacid CoA transferase subunit beta n=1 Tax=Brevibacillus formosus TaxID=54913 RepID=A0A837KRN6_9BACL|nr:MULTISPECIES: 3-oxoacid CoA-transferase subunit B [Brevibacillus]KLH99601.1 CoA-transferase [Brevibacillus formosus]MBG9940734.1 CoA-transferase [Brevibacillus formosus]MBW5466392.1 3-oxoacid CoA-transferase subunit B [Brevibacillus formosus]MED1943411.1 3-oxoacid CoA-transferase subunit B [Brevibacillus formosus]MED1959853.1 3-oxoacid CoA-transferase subunit B [Brevibacillus formosus]
MGLEMDQRNMVAWRAAKEVTPGMAVNLGIGIPELVADFIPHEWQVMFHSVNGILGVGPTPLKGEEDQHISNAGGAPVTVVPGASYFDSTIAYGMIRRRKLDAAFIGALQVNRRGDLANWIVPGSRVHGIGGGAELAYYAKKVIVLMSHVNQAGEPKIRRECTLPLTAKGCVDLIITERAVIEVTQRGLLLTEVMYPFTLENVITNTGAPLMISENLQMVE